MAATTEDNYQLLLKQAQALVEGENDWIANTANISALLFNSLNNVNFAGVYRYENQELILGPFQGKPACVHIQIGKGVCGTAAKEKQTQIVKMYMSLLDILPAIVNQILKLLSLSLKQTAIYGEFLILIQLN